MAIHILFQALQYHALEHPLDIFLNLLIFSLLIYILIQSKSREQLLVQAKVTEKHLKESEQRYKSLYEFNKDAIITFDLDGFFVDMNHSSLTISGYSRDELTKMNFAPLIVPEEYEKTMNHFLEATQGEPQNYETTIVRKDNQHRHLNVTLIPIKVDHSIVGVYAIVKDVTEQKLNQAKINHMAFHDSLTNLPNRDLLHETFTIYKVDTQRNNQMLGILNINLDRFKFINDSLGREVGDLLLIEVANRLKQSLIGKDFISRIGGDEFGLMVSRSSQEEIFSSAQMILQSFECPFTIQNHELYITPSIGYSIYPADGAALETLLKKADCAMHHAKQLGMNKIQSYCRALKFESEELINLESQLRKALEREEFSLHYQPKLDLNTRRVKDVEALIRWNHPTLGPVPPMKFISLAEETGLIVPIGEWVLRSACKQLKEWQIKEHELMELSVCVNLSIRQLYQANLTEMVCQILEETGLEAKYLVLEITESMTMDLKKVTTVLNELKQLGVRISIDDFGTGYSSLAYLVNLPIHYLKIDKSFTKDISHSKNYKNIVSTIILMAHNIGLEVIAEGVETREQYDFLLEHKCDSVQGFWFSKPVEEKELLKTVQKLHQAN
jgi:diguanylate cyclase (GGDEF)-like protein/PAS domain S-box-containing protein